MTNVARLLRGLLPVLAASAAATATALPAAAAVSPAAAAVLPATTPAITHAGEWWLTAAGVPAALRAAPTEGKGVTVAVLSTGVDARVTPTSPAPWPPDPTSARPAASRAAPTGARRAPRWPASSPGTATGLAMPRG